MTSMQNLTLILSILFPLLLLKETKNYRYCQFRQNVLQNLRHITSGIEYNVITTTTSFTVSSIFSNGTNKININCISLPFRHSLYIPHLLDDIAATRRTETPEPVYPKTIEEELEEMERWLEGEDPAHTFGYYCGLNPEDFPPAAQLTEKELKLVCKSFKHMMFTWNLDADLPKTLPPELYYEFLL